MNILLITSDQQHYSALGSVNRKLQTPHLDRLAAQGTRFDRAYCNNPLCSPSRSTMITGMYPSWHGCWTLGVKLPEDVPTVGRILAENGYRTSLVGKAHFQPLVSTLEQSSIESQPLLRDLDFWRGFHGPFYGFDHIEIARMHADESHVGQHYALWMEEKGLIKWRDYFQEYPATEEMIARRATGLPYWMLGRRHVWDLPEEFHYTTWTAERSMAQIESAVRAGKPFFHWASFHDPHPPYLAPEPWASMYDPRDMAPGRISPEEIPSLPPHHRLTQAEQPDFSPWQETPFANHGFHSHRYDESELRKDIAVYFGMISFMDQQIGRILDRLESLSILDETLIVFTTDHGHFLGQHGLIAKGPFHYEDLLRLPMIVRHPQQVRAGESSVSLQALVDFAPTFLSAAGVAIPGQMQGIDQTSVWKAETTSLRQEVIVENRHQPTALHLRTYIDERYKLTVYRDHDYGELFDLQADPGEIHNRWSDPAYATVKAELFQKFVNAELKREPTRYARIASA